MRELSLVLLVSAILFSSCGLTKAPEPVVHDAEKAISDTSKALSALFFKKDYAAAYEMFDAEFKKAYLPENLEGSVVEMITGYGRIKRLDIDSYSASKSSEFLSLYASGLNEKGVTYHRFILKGSGKKGYKMYGLHIMPSPFPVTKDRVTFKSSYIFKK